MLGSASLLGLAPMGGGLAASATEARSMVLVSGSLAAELDLMFAASGIQPLVILDNDPVAQARGQLADFLAARIPVFCITDWSDYVVMRGVARDYFYHRFSSPETIFLSDIAESIGHEDRSPLPGWNSLEQGKRYFRWYFS